MPDSLSSPEEYQASIYSLVERFPSLRRSTLVYIPSGELFGRAEGMLIFDQGVILCVQEYLNFELEVIEGYGYEVSRSHAALDTPGFPSAVEYCQARFPHKDKLSCTIPSLIQVTHRWPSQIRITSTFRQMSSTIASRLPSCRSPGPTCHS